MWCEVRWEIGMQIFYCMIVKLNASLKWISYDNMTLKKEGK